MKEIEVQKYVIERSGADCAFVASGTGMEPLIKCGDIVLVQRQAVPRHGDYGVYVIKGGYHIRRYYNKHGHRKLLSMEIDGRARTVKSADQYPCVGKVVEVIRTDALAAG